MCEVVVLPNKGAYHDWLHVVRAYPEYPNFRLSNTFQEVDVPDSYDLADLVIKDNNIEKAQEVINNL